MMHLGINLKGLSPQEVEFNFTLKELKEIASILKIKGRSSMNKIELALNIETAVAEMEPAAEETAAPGYQIGYVVADTKKELGMGAVKHCRLAMAPDEMVGKKVKFNCEKKLKYPAYHGEFFVIGCQKVWGFDASGKYTIIPGYRLAKNENDFGTPCAAYEIEIIE